MTKILLISHGNMAKGTLDTLRIFTAAENAEAISAYTDECQHPEPLVKDFFDRAGNECVLAFSDIVFGSVNQLLLPYLERENTYLFSGFNLPLLLQALALPEDASDDDIEALTKEGKDGVIFMNTYQFASDAEDE